MIPGDELSQAIADLHSIKPAHELANVFFQTNEKMSVRSLLKKVTLFFFDSTFFYRITINQEKIHIKFGDPGCHCDISLKEVSDNLYTITVSIEDDDNILLVPEGWLYKN